MDSKLLDKISCETLFCEIAKIKTYNFESDELARKMYMLMEKQQRYDILIPGNEKYLYSAKTKAYSNGIGWNYRWNDSKTDKYSEFIKNDNLVLDSIIKKDTIIDRIGSNYGQYVCPFKGSSYDLAQRSLPYYLIENNLQNEPAYHKFIVIKDISGCILRNDIHLSKNFDYVIGNVVSGNVAPVEGFGDRGVGGALQIRFPVGLNWLILFGYIEEIGKSGTEYSCVSPNVDPLPDDLLYTVRINNNEDQYVVDYLNNQDSLMFTKVFENNIEAERYKEHLIKRLNLQVNKSILISDGLIKNLPKSFIVEILDLNLEIERARRGELGSGFNVIADLVANLAMKSERSAEETERLMNIINKITNSYEIEKK